MRIEMRHAKHKFLTTEDHEQTKEAAGVATDDVIGSELGALIHQRPPNDQITTGVVEDISPDGIARVLLAGATQSCDTTSVVQFPSAAAASEALLGRTVLVAVNRHTQPVILGVVATRLWAPPDADRSRELHARLSPEGLAVRVDHRTLDLEAADEIRLTCGKSSLVLRRDGTVIVRGVTIVSRASQSNKIKGGTVSIN
jgi:hypothetical protein